MAIDRTSPDDTEWETTLSVSDEDEDGICTVVAVDGATGQELGRRSPRPNCGHWSAGSPAVRFRATSLPLPRPRRNGASPWAESWKRRPACNDRLQRLRPVAALPRGPTGVRRINLWLPEGFTDILRQAPDHLDQAGPPAQLEHALSLGERLGEPLPSIVTENGLPAVDHGGQGQLQTP